MSEFDIEDTIVALSTPPGKSGLALIRLSGPDAIRIVAAIINQKSSLLTAPSGTSRYIDILDKTGTILDDVIIGVNRSPSSYTGEDLLEISCHGSPAIIDSILSAIMAEGARNAEPGEFSRRAFFHGKLSLEEVELLRVKLDAQDTAGLKGAALALHEKFEVLRTAYASIIHALALIDAEIDFGESDQIVMKGVEGEIHTVRTALELLISRSRTKAINAGPFTVAIVGPPNVGKSSLFNALLNFERSIVSQQPGTTRDYLEAFIELDGHRIKLVDTAGERAAIDAAEMEGIRLGTAARRRANLSLLITDPSTRTSHSQPDELVVHNKIDLDGWSEGLIVSAISGYGLETLRARILELAREVDPMARIFEGAEIGLLSSVVEKLELLPSIADLPLMAESLRSSIGDLASLLGFNVSEDTLNHIFQNMCIGK